MKKKTIKETQERAKKKKSAFPSLRGVRGAPMMHLINRVTQPFNSSADRPRAVGLTDEQTKQQLRAAN